ADPSPAAVQEPSAAPKAFGSFWSSLGDSEVNLERASTPVKPPAETISTETQGSASPNEEKLCCYQCFKQFYARYAVEREVPTEFGGGCKRLCSEAAIIITIICNNGYHRHPSDDDYYHFWLRWGMVRS
ncbi:unnamed protein product, partial [Symbiodinium necroappetens]